MGLSFELLPVEVFAKSIPDLAFGNSANKPWLANAAVLKDFNVADGEMQLEVLQNNQWSSTGSYTIQGPVTSYPGYSPSGGIYAEFAISDYAGKTTDLRLRYDGFSQPVLEVLKGSSFEPVKLVSFDAFRSSLVYRTDNAVATIYTEPLAERSTALVRCTPTRASTPI